MVKIRLQKFLSDAMWISNPCETDYFSINTTERKYEIVINDEIRASFYHFPQEYLLDIKVYASDPWYDTFSSEYGILEYLKCNDTNQDLVWYFENIDERSKSNVFEWLPQTGVISVIILYFCCKHKGKKRTNERTQPMHMSPMTSYEG